MKFKSPLFGAVSTLVVLMAWSGCNKTLVRSDAQVATEIQNKINNDSRISAREIGVQSANGVVTLSGNVDSDNERALVASDAATVEGVKTVVNNLVVEQAQTATLSPEKSRAATAARQPQGKRTPKGSGGGSAAADNPGTGPLPGVNGSNAQPGNPQTLPSEPAVTQAATPPRPPKKVTIPAGTQLTVRLNDALDSERNQIGDSFHATMGAPIVIDDETVIPSGADVVGRVVDVKSAGRFAGNSALTLELTSLSVNGKTYNLQTSQWSRQGKGEGKNTAVKAGGGAAIGAVIGGLAGGGKGAAIGSVAGAGAGTGAAATKKGEQIKLGAESTLSFLLINTVTVTQQSSNDLNAGRTPLQ